MWKMYFSLGKLELKDLDDKSPVKSKRLEIITDDNKEEEKSSKKR